MRSQVSRSFVPVLLVVLLLSTVPAFAAGPRKDDGDFSLAERVIRVVNHIKAVVVKTLDDTLSVPKP